VTRVQLEAWVLGVYEKVVSRVRIEDSRVELKAAWPDPARYARRLGGHANAAHGDVVLVVLGLNEETGAVSTERPDLAAWWPQVEAEFEGVAPRLISDLVVDCGGGTVTALLIETDRAPYVVRNPKFNTREGGPVELEVPWREGTRTRSARRQDLLRVLVPLLRLPQIQVLGAEGSAEWSRSGEQGGLDWNAVVQLYVIPSSPEPVVFPFHQCESRISAGDLLPGGYRSYIRLRPEMRVVQDARVGRVFQTKVDTSSLTVSGSNREVIVRGPGVVEAVLSAYTSPSHGSFGGPSGMEISLWLQPAGSTDRVLTEVSLEPREVAFPERLSWALAACRF
jgi:hypothetical protein